MKESFRESLRCPFCSATGLAVTVRAADEREVRDGEIACGPCGRTFPIRGGIVDFLDPDDAVLASEVRGWIELAGPLDESLVTVMAALPYFPHEPWPELAPDFFQLFELLDLRGLRVLDLGAGRTWSTRHLAAIGRAAEVVAVDVLTTRFLGLETADQFLRQDGIHFERLRGDIHHLPLQDGWADVVFSCAAVHHSSHLGVLFPEVFRVLKPGGRFVFISEPVKKLSIPGNRPQNAETEVGINENFYSLDEYCRALRRAGFRCRRLVPRSVGYRLLYSGQAFVDNAPRAVRYLARSARGRRLLLTLLGSRTFGPLLYRHWNLPLSMIAEKRAA
jgi:ubiquinone/menaquinone biosynthesis C-methylase UbiE/uncharacterized protein YbaR (Trm112 family)